jgi:hypothetical protein
MQRLILAGLFCLGGALSAVWLPQEQREPAGPAGVEAPAQPAPAAEDRPTAPTPSPRSRPPARPRPESDLATRDLVLRDDDTPGAVETILDRLDSRVEVRAQDQPLGEFLTALARSGDFNLQLAEHLQIDPESPLRTHRVTVAEEDLRLETVLDRILDPLGLDWWVHHEALTIDRPAAILAHREVHTYDVARLLRNGHTVESLQQVLERAGQDPQPTDKDAPRAVQPACHITGGVAVLAAHQPAQRIAAGLLTEFDRLVDEAEEQTPKERVIQVSPPFRPRGVSPIRHVSLRIGQDARRSAPRLRRAARVQPLAADDDEEDAPDPYQQILDALEEPQDVDLQGVPWKRAVESLLRDAKIPYHFEENALAALDRARDPDDQQQPQDAGANTEPVEPSPAVRFDRELRQTPVRMQRKHSRLEAILNTILEPRRLAWLLLHERLVITTAERAERLFVTKPYDVGNLLDSGHDELELTAALREVVGRGDRAQLTGDSLVIRQTQAMHWQVAQVLAELDELADAAAQTDKPSRDHFTWKAYRVPDGASEALVKLVPQLVAPESWLKDRQANSDRVGGELRAVPGMLLVKQTASRHRAIEQLLNQPPTPAIPFGDGFRALRRKTPHQSAAVHHRSRGPPAAEGFNRSIKTRLASRSAALRELKLRCASRWARIVANSSRIATCAESLGCWSDNHLIQRPLMAHAHRRLSGFWVWNRNATMVLDQPREPRPRMRVRYLP